MESAANLLVKHCRLVLIRAAYDNYVRIRFRADDLKDPRCYFGKVTSQHKKWRENGGALITWRNDNREGPHEAIVFAECPKSLELLVPALANTGLVGVIYEPPTWRNHEQQIAKRFNGKANKFGKHMRRLRIMQEFVGRLPEFTRPRLLRALEEASQSSYALGLHAAAEPLPHTTSGAP